MEKMHVQSKDKMFMLAINRGINKRTALFAELDLKNGSFQRIFERLKKLGYVERPGRNIYALTTKGKDYMTTELEPNPELAFGTQAFRDYVDQFPEVYQAVLKLTLCSIVSKRTKIFDKFKAGYPGIILAGDPKLGKTVLGEIVCELLGLDPVAHKLDTQLVTAGEIKGRSRGRAGFDPSPWFERVISILDEIDKILNASTSEVAKFLAHSDKFYIREEKIYIHRAVPFLTLNVNADTEGVIGKIKKILGVEYIKRNVVVNVNPIKAYLGKSAVFFRRVCKDYPKASYNIPILRDEITDQEFELIADLMEKAIKTGNEAFYDERGIEIQSLAHYSLSGGINMDSSIYAVCKDRLLCLETLEVVKSDWRQSFYDEWREHEAKRDPEAEARIRKAQLERAKLEEELTEKEKEIKTDEDKGLDETLEFNTRYSRNLGVFEQWIRALRGVGYKAEADALQRERTGYKKGKWTKDRFDQMIRRMRRIKDEIMLPTQRKLAEKQAGRVELKKRRDLEKLRYREDRATAIQEMKDLVSDLFQANLWQVKASIVERERIKKRPGKIIVGATQATNAKRVLDAIRKLRVRSEKLRQSLRGYITHRGNYTLPELEQKLTASKNEARPWFEEFKNDCKDYTVRVFDWLMGDDRGGKVSRKKAPEEPKSTGYGGRSIDEL